MKTTEQWDVASAVVDRRKYEDGTKLFYGTTKLADLLADGWEPYAANAISLEVERHFFRKLIDVDA